MKRASLLCLLCSLAAATLACAQGEQFSRIKATVKYLDGNMKSSTVVDPEARTAVETLTKVPSKTLSNSTKEVKEEVIRTTTFLLDENNFALGAIHYDGKGNVRYKETFARDPAGHVVEAKFTGPEGQSLGRRVFNYSGSRFVGGVDYDANDQVITPRTTTTTTTRPVKKK
jgi:hypothetical protein